MPIDAPRAFCAQLMRDLFLIANLLVLNINRISAMLTRKLFSVIDKIIIDVFKIICCSEPTDSFMVDVTVAQLPGRGTDGAQGFTAGAHALAPPLAPPLVSTAVMCGNGNQM